MSGRSARVAIGIAGTALAVAGEAFAISQGTPPGSGSLHLAIGLTYLYGGLVIWDRDPANRTGRLMTAVGSTWFIGTLVWSANPLIHELALALEDTFSIFLLALVLAYPTGHLETRIDRAAVVILAVGVTGLNVLYSTSLPLLADQSAGLYGGLAIAVMTTVVVLRRWFVARPRQRRDLLPVLVAGTVFLASLVINALRRIVGVPDDVAAVLVAAKDLAPAAIPIALLIGFYRQSEHRLQAIVDAIPDRMFRFGRDGRVVDFRPGVDQHGAGASAASIGGRLHDLMFDGASDAASDAVGRALDTGVLQTYDFTVDPPTGRRELEARIAPSGPDEITAIVRDFTDQRAVEAELRRSRARIVEATDAERRRLERDLHDGAQQRLVSVTLALRRLRASLGAAEGLDAELVEAADAATAELRIAVQELRELARGIHPAVLTEAGLAEALIVLAERSPIPADVDSLPDRRMSPAIEAAAYFVVSEALTNVAKYAAASIVHVSADCRGSTLHVEVGDDGVGGADGTRGTGIRGLQDRVAALGGRLTVHSPAGQGTLVVADIPIA